MGFSNDELLFLSSLFKAQHTPRLPKDQKLTVKSEIPTNIASLFQNANLTLLAEVGHYQLWFPLVFNVDSSGTFTPILSAPEVIDTRGNQRSWRWDNLNIESEGYCIESISSSGVFLKPQRSYTTLPDNQRMQFDLPNKKHVTISIEPVRQSKDGIAARIIDIHEGKEQLREYLFNVHKRQYANLYNTIPSS